MKRSLSIFFALLCFVMVGCSGGGEQSGNTSTEPMTVDVYGINQLKFVVAEEAPYLQTGEEVTVNGETYYTLEGITADAGQEVTVNLETISDLPATAMAHNWILLNQGTDASAFAQAALKAKDNNYVPTDMDNKWIADTGLVSGGETKSTTFTAPEETGDYQYICSFPAHFSAGMKGTLTVQ